MAEAHPVGFRWVMKAKERGARVIHVDPHFSRTSQLADTYIPIRAGSDIILQVHYTTNGKPSTRDAKTNA